MLLTLQRIGSHFCWLHCKRNVRIAKVNIEQLSVQFIENILHLSLLLFSAFVNILPFTQIMAEENNIKNTKKSEGPRSKSTNSKTQAQDKKMTPAATAQLQSEAEMEEEQAASQPAAYSMRPAFGESFPLPIVKSIINNIMAEKLKGMWKSNYAKQTASLSNPNLQLLQTKHTTRTWPKFGHVK